MRKNVLLIAFLFGIMFLFGYIANIRGVSYPLLRTEFDISYEHLGMFISIISFGYVIFCVVGGILLGNFGVKKSFLFGFIWMFFGLIGATLLPSFLFVAAALFIISSSFGLLEINVNALAAQTFITKTGLYMSLLHFFFGFGAIVSPRVAGVIAVNLGWRQIYFLSVPLALIFITFSLLIQFPKNASESGEQTLTKAANTKKVSYLAAVMNPMVWAFAIALGLMLVIDISSSNWAALHFQDLYGLDPRISGAAFLSNYFILFTISRLASGFFIEKVGYMRSLFITTFATIIIFFIGFIFGARGIYILPALGFFTAIHWPVTMAMAMRYFREDAPIMTCAIIPIAGAINALIQFLIGLTNRYIGPAWGYRSNLFYAVLIILALVLLARRMRTQYLA